ncbi:MAG: hypothetical protein NTY38_32035, partial [Acidobacteria bacterium]|nr:hypothetical protein [Acidobacteriota bacterium]
SLELWGPEGVSGANRYSLAGDPADCSVYKIDSSCLVAMSIVATALGVPSLDLDALMVYEPTHQIIFSIQPVGPYDGGEIFVLDYNTGVWSYLNHGGHLWNTAFDVTAAYPALGLGSQNISAIEAVSSIPEPGGYTALGLAILALGNLVRRYRR